MGRIWDAHAHVAVGQAAPGEMGISYQKMTPVDRTEALLREMDRNGVERAVLQGSYVPGCNAVAQRAVRTYQDRFVAFCAFDRGLTGDEAAAQVETWLGYSEFVGVGEVGVHNFFLPGRIDSVEEAKRELRKVVEVAAARRVPVLFHTGYSATNPARVSGPLTWRDPFHLDEIIAAHREIPLILGHAGGIFDPYPEHAVPTPEPSQQLRQLLEAIALKIRRRLRAQPAFPGMVGLGASQPDSQHPDAHGPCYVEARRRAVQHLPWLKPHPAQHPPVSAWVRFVHPGLLAAGQQIGLEPTEMRNVTLKVPALHIRENQHFQTHRLLPLQLLLHLGKGPHLFLELEEHSRVLPLARQAVHLTRKLEGLCHKLRQRPVRRKG